MYFILSKNIAEEFGDIIKDNNDIEKLKENIDKTKEAFEVKIDVVERNQYMDYEIYEYVEMLIIFPLLYYFLTETYLCFASNGAIMNVKSEDYLYVR